MKTIGIIGGMSWESSLEYYRIINQMVKAKLGGFHSADILMASLDFAPVEAMQSQGRWDEATELMVETTRRLEKGGADFILIATNTMHFMFDAVENNVGIPLLHIADATASKIIERDFKTVGLLGTKFTMEMDFYTGRLAEKFGIDVLLPTSKDQILVNRVIYEELVLGKITDTSKEEYLRIIKEMNDRGAEGVILGCTEIPLLIQDRDTPVPLFNTMLLHANLAVAYALGETTF